jgi:signal transduction histidine kinase
VIQPAATRSPPHVEALEVFVEVLSSLEEDSPVDDFYSRLCEAICRLTSMRRAVIFRYDAARRRVRVAGTHGIDLGRFSEDYTVESAPIARRALEEDRVVEAVGPVEEEIPPAYAGLLGDSKLVCTPMAAGGRWVGVVLSDRPADVPMLNEGERHLLWTLGKTAALASIARIATRQAEKARQLEQRIDLARDIHEGVIQRLFGVSLALASAEPLDNEAQTRAAEEVQSALGDLRSALQRPLGRMSRATETTLVEELDRLRREHPDLGLVLEGPPPQVPPELEPLAQSVLAEAVRNAHKHARPTRVVVRAGRQNGAFVLEVANDGVVGRARKTGMGLRLAALEALQVGGVVEFGARDAGTWQVKLVVPHDHD